MTMTKSYGKHSVSKDLWIPGRITDEREFYGNLIECMPVFVAVVKSVIQSLKGSETTSCPHPKPPVISLY